MACAVQDIVEHFNAGFQGLKDINVHTSVRKKFKMFKKLLWKSKLQIGYVLQEFLTEICYLFVNYGEKWLALTLK